MTWFKVDDSFYDHPKVFDLPDTAVALWTRAGCWSARNGTGGHIPARLPNRLCEDPDTAVQALIDAGLWERVKGGGYRFHDWDDYQPTRDEAASARTKKSSGGRLGNHRRWHVARGVIDPRCPYCTTDRTDRTDAGTDGGSDRGSDAYPMPDATGHKRHPQAVSTGPVNGVTDTEPQVNGTPVSDIRSVSDRISDSESESGPNPPDPTRPDPTRRVGTTSPSSPGSRRASDSDDDDQTDDDSTTDTTDAGAVGATAFVHTIIETLRQETGRTVTPEWAARVRDQILGGRDVRRPLPYLIRALRERPRDFLPASTPTPVHDEPWMREPAPDQAEINARGRARAKAALAAARAAKPRAEESEP